ncbi:DUF4199 domain-containing protein [Halosquirtibacter xylanolyticus]|uniref:DUF4199 domain-containing protein n=1 Tax=Halosquirtibacter xylanolyticus TaxID=3374599 RepID=UPI00374A8299|nr:DUF4199 domain-containing protein [Prolixibacteraceae bacterium]
MKGGFLYHAMMYAMVLGGALVALELVSYLLGGFNNWITTVLSLFVYVYSMYHFSVKYREEQLNGVMSYWRSVQFMITLSFLASMILGLFDFILMKYIDPDLLIKMIKEAESNYVTLFDKYNELFDDKMKDVLIDNIRKISPMDIWKSKMSNYIFGGLFLGLLMSFFTRRVNSDPFHEIK